MPTPGRWPIALLVALAACGGDKSDPTEDTDTDASTTDTDASTTDTDTPGPTGDSVEVDVSAAAGGTVEAFGAVLEIPAGSLSADTTIMVSTVAPGAWPDAATIVGQVFVLGPDGTTFDPPATLTLPTSGAPATGTEHVVSWLDGAAWTDLVSTSGAGGVSAPVEHFTDFAAREVAAEAPVGCGVFAPCGGDVTGDWTPALTCGDTRLETWACDGTFVNEWSLPGGYHFDASGDFSYEVEDGSVHATQDVPSACLPPVSACDEVYSPTSGWTCAGDVAVGCTCTTDYPISGSYAPTVGTWSVTGAELTLTVPRVGDAGPYDDVDLYPFCVSGNTLTILDGDEQRVFTR